MWTNAWDQLVVSVVHLTPKLRWLACLAGAGVVCVLTLLYICFPLSAPLQDFVHRIGRTGRAGASGIANTFFSPDDSKHAKELCQVGLGSCHLTMERRITRSV